MRTVILKGSTDVPATHALPRAWRHRISRTLGRLDRRAVVAEVRRLADGKEPILAGPWMGEVGFEVLYWIPFLRWVLAEAGVPPDRVVACSRGGVDVWYSGIASRYVEIFDLVDPDTVRRDSDLRKASRGEQKQTSHGELDEQIVARARDVLGSDVRVLHPSLMFRLYRRYFWQHAGPEWLHAMARYERWPAPSDAPPLPASFVAVKFYFNDCVTDTPGNRTALSELVARIGRWSPVVSLSTGLRLDDHDEIDVTGEVTVPALSEPRTNLVRQAAVLARARAFIGTYGGYAYLPPLYGVPATAVFTDPDGFARTHLTMAQSAFARLHTPPLNVVSLTDALGALPGWLSTLEASA